MQLKDLRKFNLPDAPGVYFFLRQAQDKSKGKEILYVGKATSLKDRVKSYFVKDILLTRGPKILKMLEEAEKVDFVATDSVLEALMLEASEIKKHQPVYNSMAKDDKSYNFVTITDEDFPKILITRGAGTYGPFPHGGELREALKILRRIFPYRDEKCPSTSSGQAKKPCFNAQIGLCPGPCAGWITKREYRKTIKHISLFFEAKKDILIKELEKEMKLLAREEKFEEAEKVKRQVFALEHIQDVALIKSDLARRNYVGFTRPGRAPTPDEISSGEVYRIEAYDIAHLSGKDVVGVMTVVCDGELDKSQYRKFKIKADRNDDTNNLKEIISRRFNHPEWKYPNLIVVDGGQGQINAAKDVLKNANLDIPVVSVLKDERHKAKDVMGDKDWAEKYRKEALLVNSEAHRFAIGYHRKLRNKGFRI